MVISITLELLFDNDVHNQVDRSPLCPLQITDRV